MSIDAPDENILKQVFSRGGRLHFELDATDIEASAGFEKMLASSLDDGFRLTPSPIINDPRAAVEIVLYGGSWDNIVRSTYARQGDILYKRISPQRYRAEVTIPVPTQTGSNKAD